MQSIRSFLYISLSLCVCLTACSGDGSYTGPSELTFIDLGTGPGTPDAGGDIQTKPDTGKDSKPSKDCEEAGVAEKPQCVLGFLVECVNGSVQKTDCSETNQECVVEDGLAQCAGSCVGSCDGKSCGDDGCGGLCGVCKVGEACSDSGLCLPVDCTPSCADKECGSDGCDGSCGSCDSDEFCTNTGQCEPGACVPDCEGKQCGGDGCGGKCGSCGPNKVCNDGQCETKPCEPKCQNKECGPDSCGGTCGSCEDDEFCNNGGQCLPDNSGCDDCTPAQICENGACIPDPECDGLTWEGCCDNGVLLWCEDGDHKEWNCGNPNNCGWAEDEGYYLCNHQGEGPPEFPMECSSECEPQCNNADCGPDGCGGSCGSCDDNEICTDTGQCQPPICEPQCQGKECGPDGCGGNCGSCSGVSTCINGSCVGPGASCGDIPTTGTCIDNVAHQCHSGTVVEVDCNALGLKCWIQLGPFPSVQCMAPILANCPGYLAKGYCSGNVLISCTDEDVFIEDCQSEDEICGYNPEDEVFECLDSD
ncbi:MAG: hypothetical protein CMH54_04120 [Myxococcales bacterium]|nr:hypothetical protein [Myxococcales bacterium]